MRFTALLMASSLLTIAVCAVVVASVVYETRDEKAAARSPNTLAANPGEQAVALWGYTYDTIDDLQYSVIFIAPLVEDAPLPPGVPRWPGPGEAVLSPALVEAGRGEGITTRWGETVGFIEEAGLESPGEWIAYVRPDASHLEDPRLFEIVGYGNPGGGGIGEHTLVSPLWALQTTLLCLLVLPALVLVVIAARLGATARDRRSALIEALGGSWSARAYLNLGEAVLPVSVGAVIGLLPWVVAMGLDYRLPLTGFIMPSMSLRSAWWQLCAGGLLAALVVLVAVVLLHRSGRGRRGKRGEQSVSPRARAEKQPRLKVLLCPMFLLLATRGPDLIAANSPFWFIIIYTVGVVGTLVTLPAVVSLVISTVGRVLANFGGRKGVSSALVAGRWMAAQPGVTARLVAGIVIGIGLMGQVQAHSSRISEPMIAAEETLERVGAGVIMVKAPEESSRISNFVEALPEGILTLGLTWPDSEGDKSLLAPCSVLIELDLACDGRAEVNRAHPDGRLSELANWESPSGRIVVRDDSPTGHSDHPVEQLVLISASGTDLPVDTVKATAYREVSLSPGVGTLGYSWYGGAKQRAQTVDWVVLLGVVGLISLGAGVAMNNAGEFLRFSRAAAPLTVLTGQRRIHAEIAAWVICLPLLLATAVGLLVNYWLVAPMTVPLIGARISATGIAAMAIVGVVLALGSWVAGTVQALRQAARWTPEAD
ncbi:hypothetical protein [Streptomyces sp. ST2-7A]|uniref:hypothetical protein n=1 Tax=Streptomyces sp. ST2-7A TaxID=2907214 RepID=UPI001F3AE89C|nr:hypothetical protein [Streptomyces sp. ST2-7A]MCE7081307.1 hypothetical protein [Streptomyces sp. ST2-7A]